MESLQQTLIPPPEVIEVFRKAGEEMTSTSGAKPINEDVSFLESLAQEKKQNCPTRNLI